MREAFTGRVRTSVPSVRGDEPDPRWNRGGALGGGAEPAPASAPMAGQAQGGGGSFLGTAAATAAGVIGGALLMNSISSLLGHRGGSALADTQQQGGGSPWDTGAAGSDLAREAGVNDIGGARQGAADERHAGLFGGNDNDDDGFDDVADGGDIDGGDFGDTA
jgi:hypothetical protein